MVNLVQRNSTVSGLDDIQAVKLDCLRRGDVAEALMIEIKSAIVRIGRTRFMCPDVDKKSACVLDLLAWCSAGDNPIGAGNDGEIFRICQPGDGHRRWT